jgi:S-formylglutathione hydrolase FrmB
VLGALGSVVFLVVGGIGIARYVDRYWLYRGFAAPAQPSTIVVGHGGTARSVVVGAGTVTSVDLTSRALGGRKVRFLIYLPPRYGGSAHRYPSLYLLHGFPGTPENFVDVGDVAVLSDTLIAEHKIIPMIIVMPSGSTSFFDDEEWADSPRPKNDWATYVARDLVGYVDRHYRTIDAGSSRGIGGLSEGAYGALNIAFHHVGEFDLIEGWSPYYYADRRGPLFGGGTSLLAANSPALELARVAGGLRAHHVEIWIYTGTVDYTARGTRLFVAHLGVLGIDHTSLVEPGRHNWHLWRSMMPASLTVASTYFSRYSTATR